MFDKFEAGFTRDLGLGQRSAPVSAQADGNSQLTEFFAQFQGSSFDGGLYRVVDGNRQAMARDFLVLAFPEFAGRVVPFAYDWLGRIFALEVQTNALLYLFEPGAGEALELPGNLETFHNHELVGYPDEILAENQYASWLKAGGGEPRLDECVGYKIPLFLNGSDELGNLEISDLHVYWHFAAQIIDQVRGLPAGTKIKNVRLEE